MDTLCFRLPGHGDTALEHMNSLRCSKHFCDITIVASNKQTFKGHKVVLAACSPFLRDQFLLNPSPNLQVSVLYSSTVLCDLLKSCYTGSLQFNSEEIVNYLTAASYLQMDYIVECCRGALRKIMQLKNPSLSKVTSGDHPCQPLTVGRSRQSASTHELAPAQPHSPRSPPAENSADVCTQDRVHQDDQTTLDEQYIKVNVSDDGEETRQEEYEKFSVYIPKEAAKRTEEETEPSSDVPHEAFCPETGGATDRECNLNLADDDSGVPRVRGTGKGKGRGFKRRRLPSLQEKRAAETDRHQDLWYLAAAGMGGAFGMDYIQEGLKAGGLMPADFPHLDTALGESEGEKASSTSASSLTQYCMEDPSGGACEGSSGGAAHQGVDESVAVVGSTSSVAGPVICEQCGMTFPSVQALTVHTCTAHPLYSCPCCAKQFHHSANLTRHMAVHRGAGKCHQCPLCYKTFTQKSTLIDHMNLHSGERPHHCAYCHARFAHKPALRRHLKELHGKTTAQNFLYEQQEQERGKGIQEGGQDPPALA